MDISKYRKQYEPAWALFGQLLIWKGGKGKMTKVPEAIVNAINNILEPYGEKFTPGGTAAAGGCLNAKDAAAYLGASKSTLWRLAKRGAIRPIHLTAATVVFARADLDAYIASCR